MSRAFMPFYDGDWMRDTAHLNDCQERAYFRLVMFYWANGKLPSDENQLARIAHHTPHKWKKNREIIFSFFSDDWIHKRIEKELEKSEKFSEKQRMNSASGNAKRWPKDRQTIARAPVPQPYIDRQTDNANASSKREALLYVAKELGLNDEDAIAEFGKWQNYNHGTALNNPEAAWRGWLAKRNGVNLSQPNGHDLPNGQAGHYVKSDTPSGDAWDAHIRKTKGKSPVWDKKGGWWFPSEYPPE